ncbi:ChrR family anti-sigma-E factor [Cohaesibacter celericrescens]|uniref:Transcriptional regulator n=1 Tax=Cohaesibacter celericrescens TaxID=2067669 RepID=A0A2N5XP44_9HYPH|nr:ChrR family anti-sigma-E factor [Cohaesibacter celericrescens]PLW76311.1 transcriptional regulator [Cohaesibacter celericrescens]
MINHHLSDEMILGYAAGSLSAGQAMVVHCHLETCPHCSARLQEAEALGGALIEELDERLVSKLNFDDLIAEIESLDESADATQVKPDSMPSVANAQGSDRQKTPQLLRDVLGHGLDEVRWKIVGPGIRQFILPITPSEGEKVRLLKLSPGFVTPQHSHHGSEMTLVLKGSFCDETGRYAAGDIQEADDGLDHQPVADTDEECICLAVTDAPLEFKSIISRMIQPMVGI